MPILLDDLFELQPMIDHNRDWRFEVFKRAYTVIRKTDRQDGQKVVAVTKVSKDGPGGPFDRVIDRLNLGYSVLVRLPGNCMIPAARLVSERAGDRWEDYGRPIADGGEDFTSFTSIWMRMPGVFERISKWLSGAQNCGEPRIIVHNLDDLADRNGLRHHDAVFSAFNALREATRLGVVFAMADRDFIRLPDRLLQLFPEKAVELDAIDEDCFLNLIPRSLGVFFAKGREANEAALRLIARRLRFLDPIRAVRAMNEAAIRAKEKANYDNAANDILSDLWQKTQAFGYIIPSEAIALAEETGFEPFTIEALRNVAKRYKHLREICLKTPNAQDGDYGDLKSAFEALPKGILLHGPSGTGKTHLARWLARELALPMRIVTAADVRASDWGRAEQLVHTIFREARGAAPCVLMFDEADDLFRKREMAAGSVASAEHAVVTATLQELDGVFGPLHGVLVIMTTNLLDTMDAATFGRLTRRLLVPYPSSPKQVEQIVENLAKTLRLNLSAKFKLDDGGETWERRFGYASKYAKEEGCVRDVLAERFFLTIDLPAPKELREIGDMDTPENRRKATFGLFSPREMREAMSGLINPDNEISNDLLVVTKADVERVFHAYAANRTTRPA